MDITPSSQERQNALEVDISQVTKYKQLVTMGLINDPVDMSSIQHFADLEDVFRPESNLIAGLTKTIASVNTQSSSREVEMIDRDSRQGVSGRTADHSRYHESVDNFHYRDFVFDLPAPASADACESSLPAYNYLTDQQKDAKRLNSDRNPNFDFSEHLSENDADIEGHFNDARYFRHLDFFKSRVGAEKVHTNIEWWRSQRKDNIKPGQIKLNNAYGLYEVEHWPGARDQVIWTKWVISSVEAETLGRPIPRIPKAAKRMFKVAVLDGSRHGWQECWMMNPGSRLYCAICRVWKMHRVARNPVRNYMNLGGGDETEWAEMEWSMGKNRHPAISFGGHDFTHTLSMRDVMVVRQALGHARRRSSPPARFRGDQPLSENQVGEIVPREVADAVLAPLAELASAAPTDGTQTVPSSFEVNPLHGDRMLSREPSPSDSASNKHPNRYTLQHQPLNSSRLRYSMIVASNGELPVDVGADDSARQSRTQRPSPATSIIETISGLNRRRESNASTIRSQTRLPSNTSPIMIRRPQAIAPNRGTRASQTHRHTIPSHQRVASTGDATPAKLPVTLIRAGRNPQFTVTSQQDHQAASQHVGPTHSSLASGSASPARLPSTRPIGAERLPITYCRVLPRLTAVQVNTELKAMKHNNHDEVTMIRTLLEASRHIAYGIWSLPAWSHCSEAEIHVMAERVLEQQFEGVLTDWRRNVAGLNYAAIHQQFRRLSLRLLAYMVCTLRQANPAPLGAPDEIRQFWKASCELEARRWRMEIIQRWGRMFSVQRMQAIQTQGSVRYRQLDERAWIDLGTGRTTPSGRSSTTREA